MRTRRDEGKADWELNGLDRILSLSYLISRIGPIAIIRPMNLKGRELRNSYLKCRCSAPLQIMHYAYALSYADPSMIPVRHELHALYISYSRQRHVVYYTLLSFTVPQPQTC